MIQVVGLLALAAAATAAPQLSVLNEDPDFVRAQRLGEPYDENPVYAYSFQVADDEEQTYIAKEENRDGDDVVGSYQYVDANGALVRVTYRAGINGYTEEREVQDNFVTIRARPAVQRRVTTSNVGATRTTTSNNINSGLVGSVVRRIAPAVQRVVTTETSSSSSSNNNGDLVARILAQLTPFIRQTVSNSLTGGQTTTTTTRRIAAAPAPAVQRTVVAAAPVVRRVVTTNAVPAVQQEAATTTAIFGTGGANNIRFENPDIGYSFDLQ